jgi:hypothetical protein
MIIDILKEATTELYPSLNAGTVSKALLTVLAGWIAEKVVSTWILNRRVCVRFQFVRVWAIKLLFLSAQVHPDCRPRRLDSILHRRVGNYQGSKENCGPGLC